RRRQDMRGKGLGLICRLIMALRERGVPMLTTQPVARLALDSGRVTGVVLGSGEHIAARRGVLLATGGYGADPQMSWEFEQLPGFAHEGSGLIPQSLTGDGLVLGAEIGGIVHKVENSLRVMLSYTIPADPGRHSDQRPCRHRRTMQPAYTPGEPAREALCRRDVFSGNCTAAALVRSGASRIFQSPGLSDF